MKKQYGFCRTALLLCVWLFSSAAYADERGICNQGQGSYAEWKLSTNTGNLYISGHGHMRGYSSFERTPWDSYRNAITSVEITGVTNIGYGAFRYCWYLTSIKIGNSVTAIGSEAFEGCTGLKSVTIPENVTTIGEEAFSSCTNLKNLRIEDGADTLSTGDNDALSYPSTTPFDDCPLETVYLGRDIDYCYNWTRYDEIYYISPFKNKKSLVSLTIGNQVTAIGYEAFSGCTGLKSVTIGDNVTTIGDRAFSGCTGLTSVTIPESVTSVGENAFSYSGIKTIISLNPTPPHIDTELGLNSSCVIYVPAESVDKYKAAAGWKNFSISSYFEIEDLYYSLENTKIKLIGITDKKYNGDIIIPETVKYNGVSYPVMTIDNYAFQDCAGLTSVTIPESVTTIEEGAFFGCTGLIEFEGKFASSDNRCLILNDTLRFFAPGWISTYTMPDSVTTIYDYAFYGCTGLNSITIPDSVKTIGEYAFGGCTNLRTITSLDSIPPRIYSSTFDNDTYKNATVNYPKGSLHAYKTASGWENFTYPTAQALLNPQISSDAGETTCRITVSYTRDIDYPVWRLTFRMGEEQFTLDTAQTSIPITVTDLEPQTEYEAKFFVETKYGDLLTCETSFTTDTVKLTTLPAINISNTSATLTADIACDAVIGAGFEWRRYDDPELVPSTFSETPIVDGKISGTLRNLTPEKYYKYRPFYRTVKGKYYYGAWLAFGTRDVYAYFEPTVSTRSGEVHGNNSTISGYIVEGSDELLSQGFEYWAESPAARSTESIATRSTASNPERIEGSGSLMSVTLTGLDYNTTYYYRAYATTAKKTTYGNTESFTTGKAPVVQDFKPSGITPTDNSEVEALKTITLEFEETPSLAVKAQTITLAGNDTLLTATLAAGEGNTLEITLADTLKVAGEYTLTIPEGTFGDADFADDPTVGHCNPELVYTYTIKEPEPVEPDEPENPDDPSAVTETQQDAEHIAVYNLQGVLILETNDAAALRTLPAGTYIVNGKKMIITR